METENEREILRLKEMIKDTHHISTHDKIVSAMGDVVRDMINRVEPITLFGNILIGQKFEHDGQAYMKLAVDVGRRIYKDKPEIVHYQQFSDNTEVKKLN